ncbi:MAG: glycoside hydrolase family 125 protein [Bacilli bacterium]
MNLLKKKQRLLFLFVSVLSFTLVSCDPLVDPTSTSTSTDTTTDTTSTITTDSTTNGDDNVYQIVNGGFELGTLEGWEVISGDAFSNEAISNEEFFGTRSYNKVGQYFFKGKEKSGKEGYEGKMRSSNFIVGGKGYITFYLGAGLNPGLTYLSICEAETNIELKRYANHKFDLNGQGNNYYVENLVSYYANISDLLAKEVYLLLVDQSTDNYEYLSVDEIITYYEEIPYLADKFEAINISPNFPNKSELGFTPTNQDFASGTLEGWNVVGEEGVFLDSHINTNKRLSNRPNETRVGLLRSSAFVVGGVHLMKFRLGATKHKEVTYMSIKKAYTHEEIFRTYSDRWQEAHEENTHSYYVDLAKYEGQVLYLEFVDNSRGDWGLVTIEQINTYFDTLPIVLDQVAYDIRLNISQTPSYASMREMMSPLINSISDEEEKIIFTKNFYATIDGIQNNKGNWPGVLVYNKNGTTYVGTGDIPAMWLRDSSAQVLPYLRFMNVDHDVKMMVRGILLKQFELIRRDPYANAFRNDGSVFERKFEIDSLIYPFWLADQYYQITSDDSIFDAFFLMSLRKALVTLENERQHSDDNYRVSNSSDLENSSPYFNPDSGLIWSGYRPSDDVTYYKFFIPGNMFAVSIMAKMSSLLTHLNLDPLLANSCLILSNEVRQAIETYGVYLHPKYGKIYAFEVNGVTSNVNSSEGKLLMDVANIPSLISAPWLNYCDVNSETYQNTRAFALSDDNDYYYEGTYAKGIGDPHDSISGLENPHKHYPVVWPMAIAMQGLTSTSNIEIDQCIEYLINLTAGTYVMHEAVNANDPNEYSRDYFTWPCALFAELYYLRHFQN